MVRAHALPIAFGFSSEGRGFGSGAIGGEGEGGEGGRRMEKGIGGAMLPPLPVYKTWYGKEFDKNGGEIIFSHKFKLIFKLQSLVKTLHF